MVRVTGIDHLVLSVGNFKASKAFYGPLMAFLGFEVEAEYEGMMGCAQRKDPVLDCRRRRGRQEAQIPQGRYRLPPLRVSPRKPEGRRRAARVSGGAGGDHRRSGRRILRRLLRCLLPRSRRDEARRHALWRAPRAGGAQARSKEEGADSQEILNLPLVGRSDDALERSSVEPSPLEGEGSPRDA